MYVVVGGEEAFENEEGGGRRFADFGSDKKCVSTNLRPRRFWPFQTKERMQYVCVACCFSPEPEVHFKICKPADES
jgi:hypothetical protein